MKEKLSFTFSDIKSIVSTKKDKVAVHPDTINIDLSFSVND